MPIIQEFLLNYLANILGYTKCLNNEKETISIKRTLGNFLKNKKIFIFFLFKKILDLIL